MWRHNVTSWRPDNCNSLRFTLHKLSIYENRPCRSHRCHADTDHHKHKGTNDGSHLPQGPAALSPANGLKGWITFTTILIQMGTSEFLIASGGFSGKPHGSANTKWWRRFGYRMAYADARNPPKLWPSKMNLSSCEKKMKMIKGEVSG